MLHDISFYDWNDETSYKTQGVDNPDIAFGKEEKNISVLENDQEDLRSHMWPLNISKIPKSKEALIVSLADKYCALIERIRLNKRFGLRH
jgi:uncharacterized protein